MNPFSYFIYCYRLWRLGKAYRDSCHIAKMLGYDPKTIKLTDNKSKT